MSVVVDGNKVYTAEPEKRCYNCGKMYPIEDFIIKEKVWVNEKSHWVDREVPLSAACRERRKREIKETEAE